MFYCQRKVLAFTTRAFITLMKKSDTCTGVKALYAGFEINIKYFKLYVVIDTHNYTFSSQGILLFVRIVTENSTDESL